MKVKKLIVFGMTMMAILVSCERHPSFSSSEEALQGCKQNYGKLLKAAAYSTPVDGSMFIIHMGSEQYGVIDSLTVHFYDSDETMLLGIQHVLRDVTRVPAEVLEYQKMDEILSFFF